MSTTIEVEVMYADRAPRTNLFVRKRVGLMAAPSLKRTNVLAIILSDVTTSARGRRTFNGNPVERRAQVMMWDSPSTERALLIVRRGEVVLSSWIEEIAWDWIRVDDSSIVREPSGIPVDMPKDALVFYPASPVGAGVTTKAKAQAEDDFF